MGDAVGFAGADEEVAGLVVPEPAVVFGAELPAVPPGAAPPPVAPPFVPVPVEPVPGVGVAVGDGVGNSVIGVGMSGIGLVKTLANIALKPASDLFRYL